MTWFCVILFLCRILVTANYISKNHRLVTAQLGDNVTLECFKPSGAEESFWFKKKEGEPPICMVTLSLPNKITPHGGFQNNQRFHWTHNELSFNLSISRIEPSDVGIYFCAVYNWDIIFQNGTSLTVKEPKTNNPLVPSVVLGAALAVCVIVIVGLIFSMHRKTRCEHCKRNSTNHDVSSGDMSSSRNCDADMLNYAALSFSDKKREKQRKKQEMERGMVYSQVKYQTYD